MGTLREDLCTFMIISRWNLTILRDVSDKVVKEIHTHIFFTSSNPPQKIVSCMG